MSLEYTQTREQAFDYFDGYASLRLEELQEQRNRRPLVKSYMLETVPKGRTAPDYDAIFAAQGCVLERLDDTLFKILSRREEPNGTIGLFENLLPRHPVIYTDLKSDVMDAWVRRFVGKSPEIDRLWLSGRAFEQMLQDIIKTEPLHRFGRIVFQFDNIFGDSEEYEEESDDTAPGNVQTTPDPADDDAYIPERRATRFALVDRLSEIRQKLPQLREHYAPLYAISQLRFPARGPGGHDVYYNGKATNRSNSFIDHRQHLQRILDMYRRAIDETELTTWVGSERTSIAQEGDTLLRSGAPVVMIFTERLSPRQFDAFITQTFDRARSRFDLWGSPIRLGPTKVHVYAVDRHLWQPLFIEITDKQIVVVVPHGTCGNTIHRLVTNVQQYLDPTVRVWVGDRTYDSLIQAGD